MSKRLARPISKIAIVLLLIIGFTLVFTIYQTSVNRAVLDVLDALDVDTAPIESTIAPAEVAEAANIDPETSSITTLGTFVVVAGYQYSIDALNLTKGDKDNTIKDASFNFSGKTLWAKEGGALTFAITANATKNQSGKTIGIKATCGDNVSSKETAGTGQITGSAAAIPVRATAISGSFSLDAEWKAGHTRTARFENISYIIGKGDSTGPVIAIYGGSANGSYSTSNKIKVTDNAAGINKVTYDYTDMSNTTTYNKELFTATDRQTEQILELPSANFGKYKITATDNLDNESTFTYYYYNPGLEVNTSEIWNATTGEKETKTIGNVSISSSSGVPAGKTYDLSISVIEDKDSYGYYFCGWKWDGKSGKADGSNLDGNTSGEDTNVTYNATTLDQGSYTSGTWKQTVKVSYFTGVHKWIPVFRTFSVSSTSSGNLYYDGKDKTCKASGLDNAYDSEISYTGKMADGKTWSGVPKYAGTYTATAIASKNVSGTACSIGYATCTITIKPCEIALTTKALTRKKTYDGNTDISGIVSDAVSGANEWKVNDEAKETLRNNDSIRFGTGTDGTGSFNICAASKDVGEQAINLIQQGENAMSVSNIKITCGIATNTSAIISSYQITSVTIGSGSKVTISRRELTLGTDITAEVTRNFGSGTKYYYDYTEKTLKEISALMTGKIYDGTKTADVKFTFTPGAVVSGEKLVVEYESAEYSEVLVGERYVKISGVKLASGNTATTTTDNYKITGDSTVMTVSGAYIACAELSLELDKVNSKLEKVYDKNNDAAACVTLKIKDYSTTVMNVDTAKVISGTATFADGNAGSGKAITLENYTVFARKTSDASDKNTQYCYRLVGGMPTDVTGTITAKPLNTSNTGYFTTAPNKSDSADKYESSIASKTYDGNDYKPEPIIIVYEKSPFSYTNEFARLTKDTDFTYSYSDDVTNAGKHSVTMSFKGNYSGSITAEYEIKRQDVSVTIVGQEYTYGELTEAPKADSFTRTYKGLIAPDTKLNGTIKYSNAPSTDDGKIPDVGKYFITNDTINNDNNPNYNVKTIISDYLTIKKKEITVTAENYSMVYGSSYPSNADLHFTYPTDGLSGNYAKIQGGLVFSDKPMNAGQYTGYIIRDSELSNDESNRNYTITFVPGDLIITKKPITLVPDKRLITYGDSLPKLENLTYQGIQVSGYLKIVNGDDEAVSGKVDAGTYYIVGGTMLNSNTNPNYEITVVRTELIVNRKSISIIASNRTITYGDSYPDVFSAYAANGKVDGDTLVGGMRFSDTSNLNAGTYKGVIVCDADIVNPDKNPNYSIFSTTSGDLTIEPKKIKLQATDNSSYYGAPIDAPSFNAYYSQDGTSFTQELTKTPVYDNGTPIANKYTIPFGTAADIFIVTVIRTASGAESAAVSYAVNTYDTFISSYSIINAAGDNVGANYTITKSRGSYNITKLPVTIVPNANQGKVYGTTISNINLTFTLTTAIPDISDSALNSQNLTGKLNRASGENVGYYLISQGTVNNDNSSNPNYILSFSSEQVYYEITRKPIDVYPVTLERVYGDLMPQESTLAIDTVRLHAALAFNEKSINGKVEYPAVIKALIQQGKAIPVGTYNLIANSTLLDPAQNPNYTITFKGEGALIITKRIAYINAFGNSITYGEQPGTISFNAIDHNQNTINSSEFYGGLSFSDPRANSSDLLDAGEYEILVGTLSHDNYDVELAKDPNTGNMPMLVVNKKTVTVVLGDERIYAGHVYGDNAGLIHYDSADKRNKISILNVIIDGENKIAVVNADSEIVSVITAIGLLTGDSISDSCFLSVDEYPGTGEGLIVPAGEYVIGARGLSHDNYSFTLDKTYVYNVSERRILILPHTLSSIYGDKESDITFDTCLLDDNSKPGLMGDDVLGGNLSRKNSSLSDAGTYEITIGTLNNSSIAGYNPNYAITLQYELIDPSGDPEASDNRRCPVSYTILQRTVTVTAVAVTNKKFGDPESVINVTYRNLAPGETFLNGTASREEGNTPGKYEIYPGTITTANNPNYIIDFVSTARGIYYEIGKRNVQIMVGHIEKGYGEPDPEFTLDATEAAATGKVFVSVANNFVSGYVPSIVTSVDASTPELYILVTRVAGEAPDSYLYTFAPSDALRVYYTFKEDRVGAQEDSGLPKDVTLQINRRPSSFKFDTATKEGDTLIYTYKAAPYIITPEIIVGDDTLEVNVTVNAKKQNSVTDVGVYTVKLTSNGNTYYSGTSYTIYIRIIPYDLGILDPTTILPSVTKIYGNEDPSFSAMIDGVNDESVGVTFGRATGENVIPDGYIFDSMALSGLNYTATLADNKRFTITSRSLEIAPIAFSKTYGTVDVEFLKSVNGVNDDSFEVVFTREAGENAGSYDFISVAVKDTDSVHYSNYSLSLIENSDEKFTIERRNATITANPVEYTFDGTVGSYSLSFISAGVREDDAASVEGSGSLKVIDSLGNDVEGLPVRAGSYSIVEDIPFLNDNYNITFFSATIVINRAAITVNSIAVSYEYGQTIAPFTYSVTSGTVFDGYPLVGELGTLDNVDVAAHAIPQGTLDNEHNPDYDITYIAANCTITVIHVIIRPVASTSQVYGDSFSDIRYDIIGSPISDDVYDGMFIYGRLGASGTHVGTHSVTVGTVLDMNANYDITFELDDAVYVITPRDITVKARSVNVLYGDARLPLEYDVENLVPGDTLYGSLSCALTKNVNSYQITQGNLTSVNNPDYIIHYVPAAYVIAPRPLTIRILNQASEFAADGVYTIDQTAYLVTSGNIIEGDNPGITISKEDGTEMGFYALTATYSDTNYSASFINGTFEIRKFVSSITATKLISVIYDGKPFSVEATCSSGAEVVFTYEFNGLIMHDNNFVAIGKYVITLSAAETPSYYAPESVSMEIIIMRDMLATENGGIDIRIDNNDGFAPDSSVAMDKIPQNDPELNKVISSSETIVRAYNMEIIGNDGVLDTYQNAPSISIKVPSALNGLDVVKVIVKDGEDYSVRLLEVEDGYVTIKNAVHVTQIAFIQDTEKTNYLIFILLGLGALIVIVSVVVFMFKKRV